MLLQVKGPVALSYQSFGYRKPLFFGRMVYFKTNFQLLAIPGVIEVDAIR